MRKHVPILLGILAIAALFAQTAYAQECAQFSIFTVESVQVEPGSSVNIDVAVTNTGTCTGKTLVVTNATGDWKAGDFETGNIAPGGSDFSEIKITIPADAETSTVEFMAESANSSFTEVIIGGSEAPPTEENKTQEEPPVITPAPTIPISTHEPPAETPEETPAQTQQPEPQAEQTAGDVTGLVTGNPVSQILVFALIFLGIGFVIGRSKSEGFRYRFKR